jgi:hypothetical protein
MSKNKQSKQKKNKGSANQAKGFKPTANAAAKAEKNVEAQKAVSKKPEVQMPEAKEAVAPKKSFFEGIIDSVKKIVKPS